MEKVVVKDKNVVKKDVVKDIWNLFEEEYKERTHNFINKKDA